MKWSVKSPGGKRNQGTSCDWCSCDLVSWSPTALRLLPPNAHSFEAFLSAKTESCDGNYKTVGQNVTILAPVLWNQYVFLLMSTLLLFSVITVTMTFQETLGRQMFAMIPHHTHTRTVMHVSTLEMPIHSTEHALIHDRTCTCCSAYSHIQQHSLLEISSSSCVIKLPSELGWKM